MSKRLSFPGQLMIASALVYAFTSDSHSGSAVV
jgi:hypothetical protein